jgi:hypothetical protein
VEATRKKERKYGVMAEENKRIEENGEIINSGNENSINNQPMAKENINGNSNNENNERLSIMKISVNEMKMKNRA